MREKARAEGRPLRYDGRWRDRDPAEAPPGVKPVIRLKAPARRRDRRSRTRCRAASSGRTRTSTISCCCARTATPTYMLAVVVDDHDMGVTHIIRGDDHLTNAARQTQIYQALGWAVPVMAHIPLIHGPDGAKLSKRHGALGVDAYRAMGYLPEALRNYLVRLGWSHGDQEIFSTAGDGRCVRSRPCRALAGALRFRQARKHQRPLHPRRRATPSSSTPIDELLPHLASGAGARRETRRRNCEAQLAAPCRASRSAPRTLIELVDGARFLYAERPLALDDKAESAAQSRGLRDPCRADDGSGRRSSRGPRRRPRMPCAPSPNAGGQARRGRPAAARRADRTADLAGDFRRARRCSASRKASPGSPIRPATQLDDTGLRRGPAMRLGDATRCSLFGRPLHGHKAAT